MQGLTVDASTGTLPEMSRGFIMPSHEHFRIQGIECYGQASRAISTGQLNASLRVHFPPINLVVYQGSLAREGMDT